MAKAGSARDLSVAEKRDPIDSRGRQWRGWAHKQSPGDNKLILSSAKNGALRLQIEEAGWLGLIHIDPPFDIGADCSMGIFGSDIMTLRPATVE